MIYFKFTLISYAFLIANTLAFTLGFTQLSNTHSMMSIEGFLAIGGVALANCACVAMLLAGKHHFDQLFWLTQIPIATFTLAYAFYAYSANFSYALIAYSIALFISLLLLIFTLSKLNEAEIVV